MNPKFLPIVSVIAMAGATLVAAQTGNNQTPSKPAVKKSQCLFSTTVRDWRALDDSHLVIWGPSAKDTYLVEIMRRLPDMRVTENMAFIDGDHDGMICSGAGDQIAVPKSRVSAPAFIAFMKRLDEAGLRAVGKQYNVSLAPQKDAANDKSAVRAAK